MLPYFEQPVLHLGPIPVYGFGVLVGLGILVGVTLAGKRAPLYGIEKEDLYDFVQWILIPAFVVSHLLDVIWYHPAELLENPAILLSMSLSSFGGFLGAVMGAFAFRWRRKVPILPYVDLSVSVFPVAWVFGRAGCTVAHDHPGLHTTADNWLAFDYPDGPRWDLGFLEMLFSIALSIALYISWQKPKALGYYIALASLTYAPVRFGLDYLRAEAEDGGDARYGSLTPGQYASIALFLTGLYFLRVATAKNAAMPQPTEVKPAASAKPAT